MPPRFNSSQRAALLALADGVLLHGEHGWLAEAEGSAQLLSDGIVRWLFGEGLLTRVSAGKYRLGERGRTALTEAQAEERQLTAPAEKIALEPPLLLLEPAPHSEELDYLLVVPLGSGELERHRSRLRRIAALQAEEHFEFVQFRDEVAALPITPRLAALDLLPRETTLSVIRETGALDGLGVRACPDRGVNYGRGWLQWFGGFDPESPLIVSRRVSFEEFELVSGSGPG